MKQGQIWTITGNITKIILSDYGVITGRIDWTGNQDNNLFRWFKARGDLATQIDIGEVLTLQGYHDINQQGQSILIVERII